MVMQSLLQYLSKLLGKTLMPTLTAGKTAPDFQLSTTTGARLSLQEALAAGPVLLAFFKVSCPTCQYTFPFLQRLHQQLREKGLQTWGIVQDSAQDGARFASTFGVTFPVLVDESNYKISRSYGLSHVPSIFLVKQDGRIEIFSEGFCKTDLTTIQSSLAQMLAAAPPPLFLPHEKIPEFKPG
jgi:peroxiredoxin